MLPYAVLDICIRCVRLTQPNKTLSDYVLVLLYRSKNGNGTTMLPYYFKRTFLFCDDFLQHTNKIKSPPEYRVHYVYMLEEHSRILDCLVASRSSPHTERRRVSEVHLKLRCRTQISISPSQFCDNLVSFITVIYCYTWNRSTRRARCASMAASSAGHHDRRGGEDPWGPEEHAEM